MEVSFLAEALRHKAGRFRGPFPVRSLEILKRLIISVRSQYLGSTQLLIEMSTKEFSRA